MRLDLHSLLPRFVLVESAKAADSIRAAEVCAGVKPGEIVIFDRAYVDFVHLGALNEDGVFWVTRSKESLSFRVVKKLPKGTDKRILSDELVVLKNKDSRANYPKPLRRVRALVEVDGQEREMEFLTNNLSWSAGSVADLYRCRWQIEVFFKQITLQQFFQTTVDFRATFGPNLFWAICKIHIRAGFRLLAKFYKLLGQQRQGGAIISVVRYYLVL